VLSPLTALRTNPAIGERFKQRAARSPVEEENRRQRLVLGRGADVTVYGQVREEGFDLARAEFLRMACAVEADEAADPVHVGLLGTQRVVACAYGVTNPIEEARRLPDDGRNHRLIGSPIGEEKKKIKGGWRLSRHAYEHRDSRGRRLGRPDSAPGVYDPVGGVAVGPAICMART
jgi:hypothetical protein